MKQNSDDLATDPFHERIPCRYRTRVDVLGGRFDFDSNSRALLHLVDVAFGELPAHVFSNEPPRFQVKLLLTRGADLDVRDEPPRVQLHAGPGVLCATMDAANFAVVSPEQQAALIVVSQNMLQFPYHLRYELIEFVVYTLASRALHLISLHAGCVGRDGRGVLLIGASGGGKSTLSLHSVLQGLDLVAEDGILATHDTLRATGIGSFLHLREDSLGFVNGPAGERIRKSPVIRRRSGMRKFELDLRRTRYPIAKTPLEIVSAVVLTKQRVAGRNRLLKPLDKAALQRELDASQPYAAGQPGWAQFSRRLLGVGGFELRRGAHPDEGVEALRSLLSD
jgi:hypothetical protein